MLNLHLASRPSLPSTLREEFFDLVRSARAAYRRAHSFERILPQEVAQEFIEMLRNARDELRFGLHKKSGSSAN
jgi:hypothetical protein